MASKQRLGLALLIGVVGLGAALEHLAREVSEAPAPAPTAAFPAGATARYHLAWTMDTSLASPEGGGLRGHVDIAGTLVLTGAGGGTIAASFAELPRHRLDIVGTDALAAPGAERALIGPIAWIRIDASGAIARVDFAPDVPPVFEHVMLAVAGLAHVTPADAETDAWTATEPGPSGIAEVTYHRTGATARGGVLLVRSRDRYAHLVVVPETERTAPSLGATASIELDSSGRIVALTDDEQLDVADVYHGTSHFSLALETTGRAPVPPPALALVERHPGEPALHGDVARQHLEQAAGGLTFDGVVDGALKTWGDRAAKRAWFGRAVARLRLEPARCAELIDAAFAGDATDDARLLAFELLAAAGMPEAQAAMRDALGRPAARPQTVALVQQLALVDHPTTETAQFVLARAGTATGDAATATAYALGGIANHLRADDPALAAKLEATLRDGVANAATPEARAQAIAALGNAASPASVPAIAAHVRDEVAEVRGRAAWALRATDTPAARDLLVGLAGDADADVAATALAALRVQHLAPADLDSLARELADHPLAEAAHGQLVTLLGSHITDGGPAVRSLLEGLAQSSTDPNLQERARVVLAQLP